MNQEQTRERKKQKHGWKTEKKITHGVIWGRKQIIYDSKGRKRREKEGRD